MFWFWTFSHNSLKFWFYFTDISVQYLENAAILWSSQDSNLFLIDPYKYGENWFEELTRHRHQETVEKLDLNQ